MSQELWLWVGLVFASALSLFFAVNTFALSDFSRIKLEQILQSRGKGATFGKLQRCVEELSLVCFTLSTAANLALVLFVAYLISMGITAPGLPMWVGVLAFVLGVLLVSAVLVTVASAWARYAGEELLAYSLPVLFVCRKVCWPLLAVMRLVDVVVRRLAGVQDQEEADNHFEQEIMEAVQEGQEEGLVDQQERKMIESVIEFRDTTVDQIMTPRTEIVAVEMGSNLEQVKATIEQHGHSRLPVYEQSLDNIMGMIYAKDLLRFAGQAAHQFQIDKLMRTCYFVPESKPLRNLFAEFRQKKVHVAVVLDEYGGTAGLITNEDIIEQIVGQITDEYEPSEPAAVLQIDEQTMEVDARMRIDELNEQLNLDLPESEDYETLGGFLFSSMGRIPSAGETYSYHNKLLTIIEAAPRRISRVKVKILPVVDQQEDDSGLQEGP